jgi:uncharacterized protein YegP (UPF0339 family)
VGDGHRNKEGECGSSGRSRYGSERASMEFLIFADNRGRYRWRIVAGDGGTLAQSVSFASYVDAERAAGHVRDGVGSASFEPRAVAEGPVDLVARRAAAPHTRWRPSPEVGWTGNGLTPGAVVR